MLKAIILLVCLVLPVQLVAAENYDVETMWDRLFVKETSELIQIRTYRGEAVDESEVLKNLQKAKRLIESWVNDFNKTQDKPLLKLFDWKKTIHGKDYWLFGIRLGQGAKKIAMITHLDTVAPGNHGWQPFAPRIEKRDYLQYKKMDFLVGRGAMDDKGPAVSALIVLRSLAEKFANNPVLKQISFELIFDTSEETDMATPNYLADSDDNALDFGIVFDAMWCIRAEKGIERPVFEFARSEFNKNGLWIDSLTTSPGPINQIPAFSQAIIKGKNREQLISYFNSVKAQYDSHRFDDDQYQRAQMDEPILKDDSIILKTHVAGAQHGSAPHENRISGANPLVSLANFLGFQVETNVLSANAYATLVSFIRDTWGTTVFGEKHPKKLMRHDNVFASGNGTTYALTKISQARHAIQLSVDIRYALGHHSVTWDGKSEGLLTGNSQFQEIFSELITAFSKKHPGSKVTFQTKTLFGPDVRLPENRFFQRVNKAYRAVMGTNCPMISIGGGTDAKGHPELLAVGALFDQNMGPPINFHGENEGTPLPLMKKSTLILYQIMENEFNHHLIH